MCTIQRNILDARRWLSLFLVCCFVLCGLGGIHQRAQAIVGVDDALIGILIAGLAAVGITFVSTASYGTLSEYVGSLLDEYADSRGLTPAGLFAGTQSGANAIGQILINNRFVSLINAFGTWLKAKFSLADNSIHIAVTPGTKINGMQSYKLPIAFPNRNTGNYNAAYEYVVVTGDADVILERWNSTSVYLRFISRYSGGQVAAHYLYSDGNVSSDRTINLTYDNNYTLYIGSDILSTSVWDVSQYTEYSRSDYEAAMRAGKNNPVYEIEGVQVGINTGVITLPADSPDYDEDDGAIIDVAAPWGMTYPDILSKWLPKEWAPGQAGNPTMTYDGETAVGDQVVTGPETATVSSDPGEYAVPGLQSVFPFCIPFDIYSLLSALAADPVAPSFTWRFYVPRVCDETFTVDLSPFDTVAQIVRTVELLAFIVGLAMVTRERFLRG